MQTATPPKPEAEASKPEDPATTAPLAYEEDEDQWFPHHEPLDDALAESYRKLLDAPNTYLTGPDRERLERILEEGMEWEINEFGDDEIDIDGPFMQRMENTFLIPLGLI